MNNASHVDLSDYSRIYLEERFISFYNKVHCSLRYKIDSKFVDKFNRRSVVDYLSVGCGDGYRTFELISSLKCVDLTYLDIAPWQVEIFKKKLKPANIRKMSIINSSFEKYVSDNKFDIVESVHSFYGFIDNDVLIKKFIGFIKYNGLGFVVLDMKNSNVLNQIKDYLIEHKIDTFNYKYAEDLLSQLNEYKNIDVNYETKDIKLNLISKNRFTNTAKSIIGFLSKGNFDWNNEKHKENIFNFIKKIDDPVEKLCLIYLRPR
jgi:ubiquinone/menaquinone biosynthesis C-methylase UbiE